MSNVLLIQQQRLEPPPAAASVGTPESANCWQFWPVDKIAAITQCPTTNIATIWPAVYAALEARGIATKPVCAAAIGTIAIETASTFLPVREAFWLSERWRQANLRYYPWYGRGLIQLTWESNYSSYGQALGIGLTANPDLALDTGAAPNIFAEFFVKSGAAVAAQQTDWGTCRHCVQGGTSGLNRLVNIVSQLGFNP